MENINYSAILSHVTGISEQDIEFRNEVQCIRPSEAIEAIKLVLNMTDVNVSFTSDEVVKELEECETLDDAIMFFKQNWIE